MKPLLFSGPQVTPKPLFLSTVEFSVWLVRARWLPGAFRINMCCEWLLWCERQQGEEMLTCFLWERRPWPELERNLLKWIKESDLDIHTKIIGRTRVSDSGISREGGEGVVEVRPVGAWQLSPLLDHIKSCMGASHRSPVFLAAKVKSKVVLASTAPTCELGTHTCYLDDSAL